MIKVGTRVVNCYVMSNEYGKHGVVDKPLTNPRGWGKIWAWIKYDDGIENSEMKKYLMREDGVYRRMCPNCYHDTGMKVGTGYEGNLHETNFRCTKCGYDWWIPTHRLAEEL